MLKNVSNSIRKWLYLIYIVFTVNLLTISGGIILAWSSPVIPILMNGSRLDENPLGRTITESEASWISSLANLGTMLSPPISSYSMNKIGRKNTIILTGIPYLISSLLLAFCNDIEWYYVARIIGGLSLGSTFLVLPVYIAEISAKHIRGFLGAVLPVLMALGSVLAFAIGPYLSVMWSNIAYAFVPILFFILCIYIPESPYYLVRKHKIKEATDVIKETVCDNETIHKDLEEIQFYIKLGSEGRVSELFTNKTNVKGFIGSCMLMAFQQLSGINPINYYAESLFTESGTQISPEISSIIFGATQLGATMVTPFFVDSFGRKFLAMLSGFIMSISQMSLAVYLYFKENGQDLSGERWVPIVCLLIFVIGFNLGFGSVPYIYMAEIFPESVKYIASTISSCFNGLMAFLVILFFMPMASGMGMSGVFFFYSAWNFLAIVYVLLFIPETKGKSLQEIQDMLEKKSVRSGNE